MMNYDKNYNPPSSQTTQEPQTPVLTQLKELADAISKLEEIFSYSKGRMKFVLYPYASDIPPEDGGEKLVDGSPLTKELERFVYRIRTVSTDMEKTFSRIEL